MAENIIQNIKIKIKRKLIEYFELENSIESLSNIIRKLYILSSGFDEIYHGIKNPKRMKVSKFICIIIWIAAIWNFLKLIPFMWTLTIGPNLPFSWKIFTFFIGIILLFSGIVKTDFISGEINNRSDNFAPLINLLMDPNNHKLTTKNYNRLVILIRILVTLCLEILLPVTLIVIPALSFAISMLVKQLFFGIELAIMTTFIIYIITLFGVLGCSGYVFIVYYIMRFDQINSQIKSLVSNKFETIRIRNELLLHQLIKEHNSLSKGIHKGNLIIRRSVAMAFVVFIIQNYIVLHSNLFETK